MKLNKHDDMCPCTRFRAQDEFCNCGAVERAEIIADVKEAFGRRLREIDLACDSISARAALAGGAPSQTDRAEGEV